MDTNQKSVSVTDSETGQVYDLNIESLVGNIRQVLIGRRRAQVQATVWSKLTEEQQANEINAVTELAFDIVEKVVGLVASAGRPVIHAKLDHYKSKDGEVTAVFKGKSDDAIVIALNHVGVKHVKISVADTDRFDQSREFLAPDTDQPSLPMDDGPAPATNAADDFEDRPIDTEIEGLYEDAVRAVREDGVASTSFVQRKLAIGYNKAARLVEMMEARGVVTKADETGKREVLGGAAADADDDVENMAAAMDADLDMMSDDDELQPGEPAEEPEQAEEAEEVQQAEDPQEQEAETKEEQEAPAEPDDDVDQYADSEDDTPAIRGQKAAIRGDGPDDNPFDGGTEEFTTWQSNHQHAAKSIAEIEEVGFEDGLAGKTRRACKHEKGSVQYMVWDRGFVRGKAEFDAKDQDGGDADEAQSPEDEVTPADTNDNFKAGWTARIAGKERSDNPHAEGMTKHRIWNEGWDKANDELANDETGG